MFWWWKHRSAWVAASSRYPLATLLFLLNQLTNHSLVPNCIQIHVHERMHKAAQWHRLCFRSGRFYIHLRYEEYIFPACEILCEWLQVEGIAPWSLEAGAELIHGEHSIVRQLTMNKRSGVHLKQEHKEIVNYVFWDDTEDVLPVSEGVPEYDHIYKLIEQVCGVCMRFYSLFTKLKAKSKTKVCRPRNLQDWYSHGHPC